MQSSFRERHLLEFALAVGTGIFVIILIGGLPAIGMMREGYVHPANGVFCALGAAILGALAVAVGVRTYKEMTRDRFADQRVRSVQRIR